MKKNPSRLFVNTIRQLNRVHWWTVSMFVMAGMVCIIIALLHYQELQTVNQTVQHLDTFRQAQLDLSKGFIRVALSNNDNTPFDRKQGGTLLDQALASFEQQVMQLGQSEEEVARFRDDLENFRNVTDLLSAEQIDPQTWVSLWITFDRLENHTEMLDRESLASLNTQALGLRNIFNWTLAIAAVLFGGIGFGVYRAEHSRYQAEMKRRQSESRYRSVVEDQTELICRYSTDLTLTFVNNAYAQAYGMRPEDMVGLPFLDKIPSSDRERAITYIRSLTSQNPVASSEHQSIMPDGTFRWFQWTDRALLDEAGNIVEYQGVGRDITEHKQAEAALLESEQRLRLFVEHAPAAIAMFDKNMRYLLVSQRWLADYHLAETNLIGRSHYEVFPDLLDEWKDVHQRCLKGAVEGSEADAFPRADGSLDWVRWEIHPWQDKDGEIGGIFFFSEVITARKQAEDHIRKLNRTLTVLSDVNQAIIRIHQMSTLFERACRIAVEQGGYRMMWIGLIDPDTQSIQPVAHAGEAGDYLEKFNRVPDDAIQKHGPASVLLHTGEHVVCNDIEHDESMLPSREHLLQLGYRAMAAFPLKASGKIRGVMTLYADEPNFFDADELRLLDEMAGDISFAMEFAKQDEARRQVEAALSASEEKYRSLIESSESSIALFSADGKLLYTNPMAAAALTLPPEAAIGKHMNDLFPAPVAQYQLNSIRQVIQTREGTVHEAPSFTSGENRWYRTSVQPVRDASGEITSAIINATDITLLKQAEAALRKDRDTLEQLVQQRTADLQAAKDHVEAILNHSPDGILLIQADLHIQQTNASFNALFCCTWDDYVGESLALLIHPDDVSRVTNLAQTAITQQDGKQIEVCAIRPDGTTFDAELSLGIIKSNGLVYVIRDISDRKTQERLLRYHAALQENTSDAVIATDMDFHIQSWNRAAETVYGWSAAESLGKSASVILQTTYESEEDRKRIERNFLEHGAWQGEVIQHHQDGSPLYIHASVNLLKDENGQPFGTVSVNRDITSRKQAEAALKQALEREKELGELKTRFVSMASHEFRTPLATILALVETLSAYRHKLPEEQIERRLEKIKDQVGHLKDIMEDVLMLARMQARRVEFSPNWVNIDDFCRSVLDEFQSRPDISHHLVYTSNTAGHEVLLDLKLMRQVISNLVSNAIKYSPVNKSVQVSLEEKEEALVLMVSDEGIGIPEADLVHLFEPFHRASNVETIPGTGLGLVITKESVELHGGTITVQSQLEVGTTFTVRIPPSPEGDRNHGKNSDN